MAASTALLADYALARIVGKDVNISAGDEKASMQAASYVFRG
jgi:hypothetical protein